MTIRRLDGQWTGAGWGIVTLREGDGVYTDTFGGRPGDLHLEPMRDGRLTGTWGQRDRDRGGTIEVTLSSDWRRLTGTYLPRPDCEIGHLDRADVDLERLSFVWSEPVSASLHVVRSAMTTTVGDQRVVNAPFLVHHGDAEAEIHVWRYATHGLAIKVRHVWRGIGGAYRTATSTAVPADLVLEARRQRLINRLTSLVGLDQDIRSGLPALDDIAFFSSSERRAAQHLLRHADARRRLLDLFELHCHDVVIHGPAADGALQATWLAPPEKMLSDDALDAALDGVLALVAALRSAAGSFS